MKFFRNINTSLIVELTDSFFEHRAFRSISKMPYLTRHEYRLKLRNALVRLQLKLDGETHHVFVDCVDAFGRKKIYDERTISNPVECHQILDGIWKSICAADTSSIGNLDSAKYLDYLDWVFFLGHALRKWELENGQLFPYKSLDDFVHGVSSKNQNKFPCDPSEATKDVCKLMGEKNILDRYIRDYEHADQINDAIYLEARLLIESNYDGITDFKSRKY